MTDTLGTPPREIMRCTRPWHALPRTISTLDPVACCHKDIADCRRSPLQGSQQRCVGPQRTGSSTSTVFSLRSRVLVGSWLLPTSFTCVLVPSHVLGADTQPGRCGCLNMELPHGTAGRVEGEANHGRVSRRTWGEKPDPALGWCWGMARLYSHVSSKLPTSAPSELGP